MDRFVAYRLKFDCEVLSPMVLTRNPGSMLRGAFFGALRHDFCLNKTVVCRDCATAALCPICQLVATVDRESPRGDEVPRPFAIEPMTADVRRYEPGDPFQFGLTLFGNALSLFPYVMLAAQRMGELGLGRSGSGRDLLRLLDCSDCSTAETAQTAQTAQTPETARPPTPDSRLSTPDSRLQSPGRFWLRQVMVSNPLTGVEKRLYSSDAQLVTVPDVPITQGDVVNFCEKIPADRIDLKLLTPLRLISAGKLVHDLTFEALLRRLLRRLTDLCGKYGGGSLTADFAGLLRLAQEIGISENHTRWLELTSYSRRQDKTTPMGGLVGQIVFAGDLRPFLPYLVWGQFTHVGKDATKGNGLYRLKTKD